MPLEQVAECTEPVAVDELQGFSPPSLIKTADFATPLEEELARLQADIERARANVKEDIDFTF
jgi:hypothetical protein